MHLGDLIFSLNLLILTGVFGFIIASSYYLKNISKDLAYFENFSEFIQKDHTGDILLFEGSSVSIKNLTLNLFTQSAYCHVGICFMDYETNEFYEWSSKVKDNGPCLTKLNENSNNNFFYYVTLDISDEKRKELNNLILKLNRDYKKYGIKFNKNIFDALQLGNVLPCFYDSGDNINLMCSQLVAQTYAIADIISLDRSINKYTPKTFSKSKDAKWKIPTDNFHIICVYY